MTSVACAVWFDTNCGRILSQLKLRDVILWHYLRGQFSLSKLPFYYESNVLKILLRRLQLVIQILNMKMVFNLYGTWRRVTFEKLMMKMYDFFIRLSRLVTPYNIVQKSLRRWKIFYTILYRVTKWLSRIKKA